MVAEALVPSEIVLADLAGVSFREPGEEGAYAGVKCDDALLGLAFASFDIEGYRQMILAVVHGQPAVLVPVGQLLGHAEVSQDGAIGAALRCCPSRYVASLLGMFAAAEADFGEGFIQPVSLGLGLGQFTVGLLAAGDRPAGVSHSDALDLVGCCLQPFRCGVDDGRFDVLPVGDRAGFTEVSDGLVIAPPCGVKPELQRCSLVRCRIDPYPPGFGFGSGGVREVGN